MKSIYLQCYISAENKEQADTILNSLLEKKLVTSGIFLQSPMRLWWKGKITEMDYYNISAFTIEKYKQAIIDDVRKTSVEDVPMVWFIPGEGNEELLKYIDETIG